MQTLFRSAFGRVSASPKRSKSSKRAASGSRRRKSRASATSRKRKRTSGKRSQLVKGSAAAKAWGKRMKALRKRRA